MDPSESPVIISYPQENFPYKAILWYRFVRNYVNTFITFLHSTLSQFVNWYLVPPNIIKSFSKMSSKAHDLFNP